MEVLISQVWKGNTSLLLICDQPHLNVRDSRKCSLALCPAGRGELLSMLPHHVHATLSRLIFMPKTFSVSTELSYPRPRL